MPEKPKSKMTNTEQIVLGVSAVIVFIILKTIAEVSFGMSGILVWAISGAIGGFVGWLAVKLYRKIKK